MTLVNPENLPFDQTILAELDGLQDVMQVEIREKETSQNDE